ncbi:MAG TPA: RNA polymerase sigma factor [Candidatus Paceibacterota bacterium]|nr:RNA polymerase sigma factor [Candidatus Paceibacterota bacterium]
MHGEEAKAPEVAADLTADMAAWQRHGDEPAARRLMAALYPSVMSIIRGRLPRRVAEEDLAQEVFVRFFEKLGSYDGRAPLAHWLSRIAVNVCIDALRAEARRPELRWADLSEAEADALNATVAGTIAEAPDVAAAGELTTKLLDALDEKDRMIVQMMDLEGRTVREVQELTGWGESGIKIRAFRARRKLRKTILALEKKR